VLIEIATFELLCPMAPTPAELVRSRRDGRPLNTERRILAGGRPHRRWTSRQLHRLGQIVSHAWAGWVALGIALCWVAFGVVAGFPSYWPVILESVTSGITVVMLFAIQHLQARDRTVVQRKLDEILRSIPQADNQLIAVEEAPDEQLDALTELNRQDRLA
jgi:low affinity Fe/Cu permease